MNDQNDLWNEEEGRFNLPEGITHEDLAYLIPVAEHNTECQVLMGLPIAVIDAILDMFTIMERMGPNSTTIEYFTGHGDGTESTFGDIAQGLVAHQSMMENIKAIIPNLVHAVVQQAKADSADNHLMKKHGRTVANIIGWAINHNLIQVLLRPEKSEVQGKGLPIGLLTQILIDKDIESTLLPINHDRMADGIDIGWDNLDEFRA